MTKNFAEIVKQLTRREFNPAETMQVLTHNRMIYFSWGVSNKINYGNKALILKVSANHHKGYVVVTLDWDDTYVVHIIKTSGKIVTTIENVYFDELQEVIDSKIERIQEYSF